MSYNFLLDYQWEFLSGHWQDSRKGLGIKHFSLDVFLDQRPLKHQPYATLSLLGSGTIHIPAVDSDSDDWLAATSLGILDSLKPCYFDCACFLLRNLTPHPCRETFISLCTILPWFSLKTQLLPHWEIRSHGIVPKAVILSLFLAFLIIAKEQPNCQLSSVCQVLLEGNTDSMSRYR